MIYSYLCFMFIFEIVNGTISDAQNILKQQTKHQRSAQISGLAAGRSKLIVQLFDLLWICYITKKYVLWNVYLPNALAALDSRFVCLSVSQSLSLSHETT